MIGEQLHEIGPHPWGFVLFIHPVGYIKDIILNTRHISISNMDDRACEQECKGKHGGSRSKLCWQDKLALLEDDTIQDFLSNATCGAKCECFKKLRAHPEAFSVIKDLREARLAGEYYFYHALPRRHRHLCQRQFFVGFHPRGMKFSVENVVCAPLEFGAWP